MAAGDTTGVAKDALVIDVAAVPCSRSKSPPHPTCLRFRSFVFLQVSCFLVSVLRGLHFVADNSRAFHPSVLLIPFHFEGVDLGVEEWIDRISSKGVLVVSSSGNKKGKALSAQAN